MFASEYGLVYPDQACRALSGVPVVLDSKLQHLPLQGAEGALLFTISTPPIAFPDVASLPSAPSRAAISLLAKCSRAA